jgi:hypothetical protein
MGINIITFYHALSLLEKLFIFFLCCHAGLRELSPVDEETGIITRQGLRRSSLQVGMKAGSEPLLACASR